MLIIGGIILLIIIIVIVIVVIKNKSVTPLTLTSGLKTTSGTPFSPYTRRTKHYLDVLGKKP